MSFRKQSSNYEWHCSLPQVPQAVKDQYADPPDLLPRHGPPLYLLAPPSSSDLEASTATTVPAFTTASKERLVTTAAAAPTIATTTTATTMQLTQRLEVKEEPGVTPMEEGSDVCEGVKTGDKRSERERKNATKEEIDEVRRPSINLDSVLPRLCPFVVPMPRSCH